MYIINMSTEIINIDDCADTKTKILDIATSLIWQSSYSAIGVSEICKRSGVTKGGFYYYFKSKSDLFYQASLRYLDKVKDDASKALDHEASNLSEFVDVFVKLVCDRQVEMAQSANRNIVGCPFFTAGAHACEKDELVIKAAKEVTEFVVDLIERILKVQQERGIVRSDINCEHKAQIICQYIQGLLTYARVYDDLEIVKKDMRAAVMALLK